MWKTLFGGVPEMPREELDQYLAKHASGDYTLLDVRQPREYQEDHIPGATLIPLPELSGRLGELDKQKPLITYCAVGGRSRAAAEMLSGRGFAKVTSLSGGINAWQGVGASGAPTDSLGIIQGDEAPAAMLAVAFGLERGLGHFYRALAEAAPEPRARGLYEKLAGIEGLHQDKIRAMFEDASPTDEDRRRLEDGHGSLILEGGFDKDQFLAQYQERRMSQEDVLDLAMMIEAQAQDLYLRMAQKSTDPGAQEMLLSIADDEKAHLAALGRLLEKAADA